MRVGIIAGSGIDALPGLQSTARRLQRTPFGEVHLTEGLFAGEEVVYLSRHGERHARLSNHLNHRAHIIALAQCGVDAVLALTVCGALDPTLQLGTLVVFDDLYFPANRLPDGSLCTLHEQPGAPGRGHWIFERPYSRPLRAALIEGARTCDLEARDGGCYGHVDGPRFNSRSEILGLQAAGVVAVSQTAGPETVLAGEAQLPYALLGYITDYANGVVSEPTPTDELMRLLQASGAAFTPTLAAAIAQLAAAGAPPPPVGTVVSFD